MSFADLNRLYLSLAHLYLWFMLEVSLTGPSIYCRGQALIEYLGGLEDSNRSIFKHADILVALSAGSKASLEPFNWEGIGVPPGMGGRR